ncbi:MAG TPA: PEP-CTERM sorting domain-containing protein [Lacipirellulaceae bacterium]|nr:PEP-CTERM sorting domain-containing protein [Lacipirellulaceae bacterium]
MNCRHLFVLILAIAALCLGGSATVLAQSSFTFQAPTGPGGTWNIYRLESGGLTFKAANNAANATVDPVTGLLPGRLVSIQDASENTTIWNMAGRTDTWIGLTDREGAAPGAQEAGTSTTTGWAWTSGEPFTYQNFGGGEPNDSTGEDAAHIRGDGIWNDNKSGYGVDDPIPPVLVPGSSLDETAAPSFRYVVEWPTALAAPAPGIRAATFLPSPGSLPGPSGGIAGFGVREIKGLTGSANIIDAIQKATSGMGTFTDGQHAILDVTDPQTNANGGPVITSPPLPYLTNTAADDNDIITIAKGRVRVPASGTYTVQVRADDGFALRIVGGTFTSINGGNASRGIDPLDPSTMFFYHGTGDTDARGVITLAAGEYDVEFINWEGGGGAFYEVTTGTGASPTTWLPMGAGGSTPFIPNTVRLTAPATVLTAAEGGGMTANNISEARALIAAAEAGGTANTGMTNIARVGDGQPVAFPAGTPVDEFASLIRGSLTVDDQDATPGESITLTFGLFSDDGHQFRVVGQDFDLATDFTGDGTAGLVDVSGDMSLTADYFTGNTNAFGRITLVEGTYDFESYMFEGGGGADQETFWSVGDKTATGFDSSFLPLSTLLGTEANQGWSLVPEPSAIVLMGLGAVGLIGLARRRK